ncbi:hypothetical protein B296_00014694 [Ensete ventricosum]|uniref:Uncharacterized protein n=1 Tax=Ensete ventricosum TaxID=4639 RepID=A0A426Y955_ENSVE|nr:hypothetical protein B296_00014694 [Ensete ventricosum]
MQSARNSSMMLEEAYATGVAVLSKYAEQRDRLKALDILNTVGLSNTVLKLIERRHRVDKWIAYTVYWFIDEGPHEVCHPTKLSVEFD